MKSKIMDGNEACSYVSYQFSELVGIYPITPASPMAEYVDKWSSLEKKNFFGDKVEVVQMQSEAGAIGMVHGALQNGTLASTYTASQGLLLMIPNMYKIAGEMLPCVINVAARSLAKHSLSILGDHQDIYATRATGFAILASSSVQQVMDLTSIAYLSAIKGSIPFINFFDGFRTSHELQKIEPIDMKKIKALIDKKKLKEFRKRSISNNIETRGTNQNDDIYFQICESQNKYYDKLPDIVNEYMICVNNIIGKEYKPFNYYGSETANKIIVAMGSVCETIKETVDYLNKNGENVGLIEVHLYRPFSAKYLLDVLPKTVSKIAVLDRTKESGSQGEPLYLDVKDVISKHNSSIKVIGGRYGLSGKNTTPYQIKAIYSYLDNKNANQFTIGIDDDLTNLSLKEEYFDLNTNSHEMLIYGYGSDGMVSASKDIIKIIGTNTKAFVQGYFEYDSKKSGGLTRCHLRFGNDEIRSTYYVEKPSILVCTKDTYLSKYRMLDGIKDNGIFILNTSKNEKDIFDIISNHDLKILKERNIKFYIVNANKTASRFGLDNKINMIMQTVIFKVGKIIPFDFAIKEIKNSLETIFTNKGKDIIQRNLDCIDYATESLKLIKFDKTEVIDNDKLSDNIFDIIERKEGNSLSVSSLEKFMDGSFPGGMVKDEHKNIADKLPCYNSDNCIMCNRCSFVCPHSIIRPVLLNEKEEKKSSDYTKSKLKNANIKDNELKYSIAFNLDNCTGCGLCSNVCPGLKGEKAIDMLPVSQVKTNEEIERNEYLLNKVSEKHVLNVSTVKGSQFIKPKFEFCGACAGCGETPYLKLLTQLFGNELVIANATGCSSIYGGSVPKTTYSVPWVNSLFEDNAEFGYGIAVSDRIIKSKIRKLIYENINKIPDNEKDIYINYYKNMNYESSCLLYEIIGKSKIKALQEMKEFIKTKSFWIVGGDGWAYDIGYGGLDHVLANNENINILVLDTEVYSNTGGQVSKSTKIGSVAKFAANGKKITNKNLAKMCLSYPHVYVGTISLGANMQQTIKTLIEAKNYKGPSIVIAYSPCIAHGITNNAIDEEKLATESGYFPLFRYDPIEKKFTLDSDADFSKYFEFLLGENRYRLLKKVNQDEYKELLEKNKENAINTYNEYIDLETMKNDE